MGPDEQDAYEPPKEVAAFVRRSWMHNPNTAARLLVLDKWIQRPHCRRAGNVDGVLELPGRRISVTAREPASVCLDVTIKLGAAARENNAVARKRIARADHLPRDVGRIAA